MNDEGDALLSDEAQADAAPVAEELSYKPRKAWRPGKCAGFVINTANPVARLHWPKRREAKEFLARIRKRPPAMPAIQANEVTRK